MLKGKEDTKNKEMFEAARDAILAHYQEKGHVWMYNAVSKMPTLKL